MENTKPDVAKVAAFQIEVAQAVLNGYKVNSDEETASGLDKVIRYLDRVRLELDPTAI